MKVNIYWYTPFITFWVSDTLYGQIQIKVRVVWTKLYKQRDALLLVSKRLDSP